MLRDQLLEEVLVEAVQALDRVEHREARPDAEEQRHLAEAGLEIDDDRRPAREPRDLDGAVDRDSRRAGAALGAEETWVTHGWREPACAASRRDAVLRIAPWNDSSIDRDAWLCPPGSQGKNSWPRRASRRGSDRIRLPSPRRRWLSTGDRPAAARSPPCQTTRRRAGPRPRRRDSSRQRCLARPRCRQARRTPASSARPAA